MRLFESALVVAFLSFGCGAGSSGMSNLNGPSSTDTTTINIVGSNGLGNRGNKSFSPNPASANQGTMLAWHNLDTTVHHIVLDDGSLDTGNIAPGTSSQAKSLSVATAQYHCSIHPTMIGSINTTTSAPPPSMGPGYLTGRDGK